MVIHSPTKTTSTPWPALLPQGDLVGKPPIPIARPATVVGSRQTAHLRLHSSQVSKAHALILSEGAKVHIADLNSRTKVFINGRAVKQADLKEGDQIKIGRFLFRFTAGPQIQSPGRRRVVPPAQLESDAGDMRRINQRVIVIGQREGSDLVIPGENVSTTHAAIFEVSGRRFIMDLGSRAGTLVNNHKTQQVELKIGDVIDIGGTEVRYVAAAGAGAAAPVSSRPARPMEGEDDELLALESLSEPQTLPKPSGQSRIFQPPVIEDDDEGPLPLESSPSLPEPSEAKERIAPEPEPAPLAEASAEDQAAEKAAEDELMALLEPEVAAEIRSEPEPEPVAKYEVDAVPQPLDEPELLPVENEIAEEAPIALEIEAKPSLVEKPPVPKLPPVAEELAEATSASAALEQPLLMAEETSAELASAPLALQEPLHIEREEPEALHIPPASDEQGLADEEGPSQPEAPVPEPASAPLALEEPLHVETEEPQDSQLPPAPDDDPLPIEEEALQPELIAVEPQKESAPEPEPIIAPAALEGAVKIEAEEPQDRELSPVPDEQPAPVEMETSGPEPIALEAQAESPAQAPASATANADLIPEVIDHVIEEHQQAAAESLEPHELPPSPAVVDEQPLLIPESPEPEAAEVAPVPAAPLSPTPPPIQWINAPSIAATDFTPALVTINPTIVPADFSLDEFLSGGSPVTPPPPPAKKPEAAPLTAASSAPIIPADTPSITAAPSEIEEEDLLDPLPDELQSIIPVAELVSPPTAPQTSEDVSQAEPPIIESPAPQPTTPLRSPGRAQPRGRLSPPIPPRWEPVATSGAVPTASKSSSRPGRKRLSVLIVLMAIVMVLAALAVWKYIRPLVVLQGIIRYDGTNRLGVDQREMFQKNQIDLLGDGRIRSAAEALFRTHQPAAAGFFVDQDLRDPQLQRKWIITGTRSDLELTYSGSNPALDAERLSCLLQAIYEANADSVSAASAAQKTVEQKNLAAASARAELAKVRQRRDALAAITRPDLAEISAARAAVDKLDGAWTAALTARKAIAADVDHLQHPAIPTTGPAADRDSTLGLMTEKLAALNGRVAEAKSAAAKQAADARKSLNTSIDDFQNSLATAQGMMKDNPALASYITSAQKLHDASWKLQGDLIERQERQQKQLVEYKKRLEEQVEARKREVLESDPDIKELTHLLELKNREVNALASSGGLKRDVERLREQMQYIEGRIISRRLAVSEDKFYNDAIGGMKQIIDSVQKQLDADRAASEKLMNELETRFRNTSPEIETLPAAQRSLAARLAGQVDAMQNARKSYGEAVQAQDADANARLKELQAQAAAIESDIALRRKELSAEQQKKLTEQQAGELRAKQAGLAEAEKSELAAREAYRQKIKELDQLTDRERAWQSTREELQHLTQLDEPAKKEALTAAERALTNAQHAAEANIAPQPPAPARVLELQDNRALYVTAAVLAVGLLFGSLIFFTHSEPRPRHNPDTPISG